MSSLLCCNAAASEEADSQPANLQTLRPTTADSTVLPSLTVSPNVPRRSDINDAQALRDIFGSSSSVRGYQTAVTAHDPRPGRPPSFDFDFRMPMQKSPRKNTNRLEALGHTIKKRLSEARLSKSSSKRSVDADNGGLQVRAPVCFGGLNEHARLLGMSHQSTAMSELLRDRTASQGGYDSDARSLETSLLRSNPTTIRLSSQQAKDLAVDTEIEGQHEQVEQRNLPQPTVPATPTLAMSGAGPSSSLPDLPKPPKVNLKEALDDSGTESPNGIFDRRGIDLADGTVKVPDAPDLRALGLPSLSGAEKDWRLSMRLPTRDSSLRIASQSQQDVLQTIKKRVAPTEQDSADHLSEEAQGLLPSVNPVLLEYLNKYGGQLPHSATSTGLVAPGKAIDSGIVPPQAGLVGSETDTEYQNTNARHSTSSTQDSAKGLRHVESDQSSVNLFNMRISQRLASNSLVPVLSPSHSIVDSLTSETSEPSTRLHSFSRMAYRVATEHNRRPSDPGTRRLFEKDPTPKIPAPRSLIATSHSLNIQKKSSIAGQDDASSVYVSDAELPASRTTSMNHITRDNSTKNLNSLAVGGRTASGGIAASYISMTQISNAEESAWLRGRNVLAIDGSGDSGGLRDYGQPEKKERCGSTSGPAGPSKNANTLTPTPKARRHIDGNLSTADNESLSEISISAVHARRNEGPSDSSAGRLQDRKNERFSEVYLQAPTMLQVPPMEVHYSLQRPSLSSRDQSWEDGHVGDSKINSAKTEPPTTPRADAHIRECATNMWERALKKAAEEDACPQHESRMHRLRPPPSQFDRLGHRRSRTNSNASGAETRSVSTADGMQAPGRNENKNNGFVVNQHQHLEAVTTLPSQSGKDQVTELATMKVHRPAKTIKETTPTRRSVLDLKRFATISGPASRARSSRDITSLSTFQSAWTRYPSHTRDQRNGPAGFLDDVVVRDFETPNAVDAARGQSNAKNRSVRSFLGFKSQADSHSRSDEALCGQGSWRMFSSRKTKNRMLSPEFSQSPSQNKTASHPVRRGHGLVQSMKRLYRSSSSDLKNYRKEYGHRSSMSAGQRLEYPELEVLPGEGLLNMAFVKRMEMGRTMTLESKRENVGQERGVRSPAPADDAPSEYETAAEDIEDLETPRRGTRCESQTRPDAT